MDFPPPLLFLLFRRKGHGGGEISVRKGSGRGLSSLLRGTSGLLVIAIDSKLVVLAVEELYRYFGGVCNEFPSSSALPWHLVNCQSPNRNFASMVHLSSRFPFIFSRFNIVLMPIIIIVIAYTYISFVFKKFCRVFVLILQGSYIILHIFI